jgi:hypothetical protein
MGLDSKTYWLTDRQSQCDFDFDFDFDLKWANSNLYRSLWREYFPGAVEESPLLEAFTREQLEETAAEWKDLGCVIVMCKM